MAKSELITDTLITAYCLLLTAYRLPLTSPYVAS